MLGRLGRVLRAISLVVAGLVAGALAAALRKRPVPPAVEAADPRPGAG